MITSGEINKIAHANNVGANQIEKDYVISWVLYGISESEGLSDILAFKGGTVLKKAYFEDYRFSEDLDFTLLNEQKSNEEILEAFESSLELASNETGLTLQINHEKDKEHQASGSLKFKIEYVAPLKGKLGNKDLKVDVTRGEILEFDLEHRRMFATYSDFEKEFKLQCYSLSEVLIEKMAAIMGRTIPRDVYDLWYLLEVDGMDITEHQFQFMNKASNKGHDPALFNAKLDGKINTYKRDWDRSLKEQIRDLPDFKEVIRELHKHFRKLI